jgi:hypothetical protein
MRLPHVATAVLALAGAHAAQSPVSTMFASNNQGNVGGTLLFDLIVRVPLTITRIDLNAPVAGLAGTLDVRLGPTTYVGREQAPSSWITVSAGNPVVTAATNAPTVCLLQTPVMLGAGSYGVMLKATGFAHAYTNGAVPSPGNVFSTTEVTLAAGAAQNLEFAMTFTPRVANVNVHYVPAPGSTFTAFQAPFGNGCYAGHAFYETFPAGLFDLRGAAGVTNSVLLVPNGRGGYVIVPGSNGFFAPAAPPLPLTANATSAAITLPFPWTFPGGTTNSLRIGANGMVFPTASYVNGFAPAAAGLLAGPNRFCIACKDLAMGIGSVHFDVDPSFPIVYCTWLGVPNLGGAGTANTMQMAIFANGAVELRYQEMDFSQPTVVGHSQGSGTLDPGPVDISAVAPAGFDTGASGLPLTLAASAPPQLGTVFDLVTAGTGGAVLGASILSLSQLPFGAALASVGMPGCFQYTSIDATRLFFPVGGTGRTTLALPANPAFAGLDLFSQSLVFVAGVNAFGALVGNGLWMHVN